MIRNLEEILNQVRAIVADDTADAVLELIEDVSDTVNDLETRAADTTNWQERYTELDQTWRKRYRDRFYSGDDGQGSNGGADESDPFEDPEEDHKTTYESLFKAEE